MRIAINEKHNRFNAHDLFSQALSFQELG